jgi:type II secretory ATPase GspE/PulE/Tfp pilus assembly ATPase PilB-like protein
MALEIQTRADRRSLLKAAMDDGMVPMAKEALDLVKAGKTTLEEVISAFLPLSKVG